MMAAKKHTWNGYTFDNPKKPAVLEALEKSIGVVTTACQKAAINRQTFYNWKRDDEAFADAVQSLQDVALDFVESKMFERINGTKVQGVAGNVYKSPPEPSLIKFYLATKGKKRGYVERKELTGEDGQPIKQVFIVPDFEDDSTN